jgi:hypothetical protein
VTADANQAKYGLANISGTSLETTSDSRKEVYVEYIPDSQIEIYSKTILDS